MGISGLEPNLDSNATNSKDEDRATTVHALFMRLHDFEGGEDGIGLKDEWRGVVSRSGMDVVGGWVCRD